MKNISNRMKDNYENRHRIKLIRRMPVIMRLDGKAFHTLTKGCDKPFDERLQNCMVNTAKFLCSEIQGAKCAYIQSDEISLLLTDFDTLQTDAWFDYNIQKMCSVAAGYASIKFTLLWGKVGVFDCRVFNMPREEVCNYFIWRQKDWERNSMQMLSQVYFSHTQLHKKNTSDMHEMLYTKGVNWSKLDTKWKNGVIVTKSDQGWGDISDIIFTKKRAYIEDLMIEKSID